MLGFGRRKGKTTCEECPSLDIKWLRREGLLYGEQRVQLTWGAFSVIYRSEAEGRSVRLNLTYIKDGKVTKQDIHLGWRPCTYGGYRPYFTCPNCNKMRSKLYTSTNIFACRRCYNLCYASQLEKQRERGQGLARKLARRLGGEWGQGDIPKPKGMHWRTYNRIGKRMEAANNRYDDSLIGWIDSRP